MSKCAVLHVVKGKRHRVDGLELSERDELLNGMTPTGGSGSARIRRHVKSTHIVQGSY